MAGEPVAGQDWRQPIQDLIVNGDFGDAIARCRALRSPDKPNADLNFLEGLACVGAGKSAAAILAFVGVLKTQPNHAGALCALGTALHHSGRLTESLDYLELATHLHPDAVHAWIALGSLLLTLDRNQDAEAAYGEALKRQPAQANALAGLGTAAQRGLRYSEAESAFRRVLALEPGNAMVRGNLGVLLSDTMRQAEAQEMLQSAIDLRPDDPALISNRLYGALYDETASDADVVALHAALGARMPAVQLPPVSQRPPDPDRPLTVGYLSPDFRRHPIGFFLHDVLGAHDRKQVRIVALHDSPRRDWLTEALNAGADDWRPVAELGSQALAALIGDLGIDVLVDLTGHMQGNRLPVFAGRTAPVQVSWAGYPGTTGIPEMDAVLVDRYLAAAAAPGDYTESLIGGLPVYACYAPPDYAPAVREAVSAAGEVTFGCFANAAKFNCRTASLWGEVMAQTPGARLLFKTHACADSAARDRIAAMLAENGIGADRLILEGPSPHDVLLDRLGQVDIVLDCAPYSGSTSVMEALWMGVPVVTLAGRLYHQRHGAAVLHAVGLDDLITQTESDYVDAAVALAHDAVRRRQLRHDLRGMMASSPLRDGAGMARALENIYRDLWRTWCARTPKDGT